MSLPRVIEAQVQCKKKNQASPSSARRATITILPGRIDIGAHDNKFPPLRINIKELVSRPKRPQGKSVSWVTLDFVQNIDAKYSFVNIQVDAKDIDDLVNSLNYAWDSKPAVCLFADDPDEAPAPVHIHPPNKKPAPSTGPPARKMNQTIKVDEEGSAAHPGFDNSFKPVARKPLSKTTDKLKGMFTEYGINDDKTRAEAEPVHIKPQANKTNRLPDSLTSKNNGPTKKNVSSYASDAQRRNKDYKPVDSGPIKPHERSDGVPESSFYGGKQTTANHYQSRPSSAQRISTKDSLDAEGLRGRVKVTPGIRDRSGHEHLRDKEDGSPPPPPPKSLTSVTCAKLFDDVVKPTGFSSCKPSIGSTSTPFFKLPPSNSYQGTSMRSDTLSSEGYLKPWAYRQQENIGNSCYMNSTMQMLAACPIFVDELSRALKSLGSKKSETFISFHNLMLQLTGQLNKYPVSRSLLEKVRSCLMGLDRVFEENGGFGQQDAEEALTALLGAISDECTGTGFMKRDSIARRSLGGPSSMSPVKTPIKRAVRECDASPIESPSSVEMKRGKPAVCDPVDLMEVRMSDVKTCNSCGDTRERPAMEHRVHLGMKEEQEEKIPATVKCVQQLLAAEVSVKETLGDFNCEKCQQKTSATSSKKFVQFGEYLIIVFKRFNLNGSKVRKLNTPIRVPLYMEMADLTDPEERKTAECRRLDETIVLEERTPLIRNRKINKSHSPIVDVMSKKTEDWIGEEDTKTEVTQADSTMIAGVEEKEEKENGEMEGGWEKEDVKTLREKTEKKGQKGQKDDTVEKVFDIEASDDEDPELAAAINASFHETAPRSAAEEEKQLAAALAASMEDVASAAGEGETRPTPPTAKNGPRLETPATVKEVAKRREDSCSLSNSGQQTPSRKRPRQRASTGNERERREKEDRLSSGSRSSICHSEPGSRKDKRSRIERMMDGECSVSSSHTGGDEVTIDDREKEEEEEKTRRLSRESKTPCYKMTNDSEPEPKRINSDPFAFDAEDELKEEKPKKTSMGKTKGKGFTPPTKRPLIQTHENGQEKESPTKEADRKKRLRSENIVPSPLKSSMEQKGGGKRIVESSKEDEKQPEEEFDKRALTNVTTRRQRRTEPVEKEKEEEEEEKKGEEGVAAAEEDGMESDKEKKSEDDLLSGDDTTADEDEVVGATESEDEVVTEDGKEEELQPTEGEEEMEEAKEEKKDEVCDKFGNLVGSQEADIFDTPNKHEQIDQKTTDRKRERVHSATEADEDGRVLPILTPDCSPVKKDEEMKVILVAPPDAEYEEIVEAEESEETEEQRAEWDRQRKEKVMLNRDVRRVQWRELFADSDPPPPRDHIVFRPVDDRWMRGQCRINKLDYAIDKWEPDPNFHKLRAQSNVCKIDAAPSKKGIVDIEGDGNCFFRAISWYVTGSVEQHASLREKIVHFMFNFPHEFGTRMTGGGGQQYTKEGNHRMLLDGEWATQCELYGAATLLGVDIYTYHQQRWKPYRPLFEWSAATGYKVSRMTDVNERTRFGIYLTNDNDFHYDVVTYMDPVVPVSKTSYRLLATVLHRGYTAHSGHYVADVFDQKTQKWLHCDDSKITRRDVIDVLENAMDEGYVLVYGRNESVLKMAKEK